MRHPPSLAAAPTRPLAFCGLAAAACLATLGGATPVRLAFLRPAVEHGEVWRLLTCHLVHAGPGHLAWNLAGLVVAALAVGPALPAHEWLAVSLVSALVASSGALWFSPETVAMAGLSAVLHGLLAAGAWAVARRGEPLGWGLLGILAAKHGLERLTPLPWASFWLGDPIATEAHVFGSLGGLAAALLLELAAHRSSGTRRSSSPPSTSTTTSTGVCPGAGATGLRIPTAG